MSIDIFSYMNIEAPEFFSILANPIRLRCLLLLERNGELCVCELTHALGAAQPTISRHLAQLREAGIVIDRRQGLWIHYRLHPDLPAWADTVLKESARAVADSHPYASDQQQLIAMPDRPGKRSCA